MQTIQVAAVVAIVAVIALALGTAMGYFIASGQTTTVTSSTRLTSTETVFAFSTVVTTRNVTQTVTNYSSSSNFATVTNNTSGLSFTLFLNSALLVQGQAINITAYVTNDRSVPNNLSSADSWSEGWFLGWAMIDSCESFANAQVFQGYYTQSNISSLQPGSELRLADPNHSPGCPISSGAWYTYFPFLPHESKIGYQYSTQGDYGKANLSSSTLKLFDPGVCTVAAGDEWGQSVLLHFTVLESSQQPVQVVSMIGPIPPYNPGGPVISVTLKNVGRTLIISLNATLKLPSAEPLVRYSFNFNVSSLNPLLQGQSVPSTLTAIGAGIDANSAYPLTTSGTLAFGLAFNFTQLVNIVPPN